MPRVTALRERGAGQVAVEIDGEPWRTLPVEVVARAGLAVGLELERPRLRSLRRELRQGQAVRAAARALARRDRSEAELAARLERAGFAEAERDVALDRLRRAGYVDDRRFAAGRAQSLAARGYGDSAIRFDLERNGLAGEVVEDALAALAPEPERAATVVRARGRGAKTARFLAQRGFGDDAVEAAVGRSVADEG